MCTTPRTRSAFPSSITSNRVWPEETQRRSALSAFSDASTVTTAGIGVITSRAACSWRWKTPDSIPASPGSSWPANRDWDRDWSSMIALRSSEVGASLSSRGLTPNSRTIAFEMPVRPRTIGAVAARNQLSGAARNRAVGSGLVMASIFGTCSPTLMWSPVTSANAIATEIPTATPCERAPKIGSISVAIAGSPRNPIPIEAIVIPTWHADRYSSIRSSW